MLWVLASCSFCFVRQTQTSSEISPPSNVAKYFLNDGLIFWSKIVGW